VGSIVAAGGTIEPIATLAGSRLGKGMGLITELVSEFGAEPGIVLTAADVALKSMDDRDRACL
jgi:3-hydroxyisobutyrate dehydrogenase